MIIELFHAYFVTELHYFHFRSLQCRLRKIKKRPLCVASLAPGGAGCVTALRRDHSWIYILLGKMASSVRCVALPARRHLVVKNALKSSGNLIDNNRYSVGCLMTWGRYRHYHHLKRPSPVATRVEDRRDVFINGADSTVTARKTMMLINFCALNVRKERTKNDENE